MTGLIHSYKYIFHFVAELMFLETSALSGENVEETFLKCARSILTKIESGMKMTLINLNLLFKVLPLPPPYLQ